MTPRISKNDIVRVSCLAGYWKVIEDVPDSFGRYYVQRVYAGNGTLKSSKARWLHVDHNMIHAHLVLRNRIVELETEIVRLKTLETTLKNAISSKIVAPAPVQPITSGIVWTGEVKLNASTD